MHITRSIRSYASVAALLLTGSLAAPALARTTPASAGRAQLGADESSFNATEAFVNNTSASNKVWSVPLIFDTTGTKTIIVRGSVQAGGSMSCRAVARGTSNTIVASSSTLSFPATGVTTSVTLTLSSVPSGAVGVVHCVLSGSNTALLRQLQPLRADCRPKTAKVFAEAPDGGFELGDPAQQNRSTEIGAHTRIVSKT